MKVHPLLHAILVAMAATACAEREVGEACMVATADSCPDPATLDPGDLYDPWDCDNEVVEILSGEAPEPTPTAFQDGSTGCCYEVELVDRSPNSECVVGRPYRHDDRAITAAPSTSSAWEQVALAEHASIAAFARLALELMAHGAPPALLADVARAMADEVRHASLAFEIAGLAPGPFPFPGPVEVSRPLAEVAAHAVREGCVGETLSALATRRAAEVEPDPERAAALRSIADDEDRHAALSWAVVAWAVRVGGDDVRAAVVEALRAPHAVAPLPLLTPEEMGEVARAGVRDVVAPAATALLAA